MIPPNGSRGTLTPRTSAGQDSTGLWSWRSKTDATKHIGTLEILKSGPAQFCMTGEDPDTGEYQIMGSLVVSLDRENCEYYPGMPRTPRAFKSDLWTN